MTFNPEIKRIGFCCKYLEPDQTQPKKVLEELQRPLNTRTTTIAWLNRQRPEVAEQRLWELITHNAESFCRLIEYAGSLPENLRMVRLGSDCLPAFTEPTWRSFYHSGGVRDHCERVLARVGETARALDVLVGFHPGQFCVMASDRPDVVERSVEELEYHATLADWMGYGKKDFDLTINVHLSGRLQAEGFLNTLPKLSTTLRKCLTLENDEYQAGLNDLLPLADHVGILLDIHHHLIHDEEYIQADDPRIKRVIESWRGSRRPLMHYSQPKEEYMHHFDRDHLPTWDDLTSVAKKGKLRQHSYSYHNRAVNEWALDHLEWADIECEAKAKNLAQRQLYEHAIQCGVLTE
jgi:UV DNA damage endonuclease